MNELTLETLKQLLDRLGWEVRRRPCQMILGLFFLTVLLLTCDPLQAREPRGEYEAPFSGKSLLGILQPPATVSCFSDLSAATGYYGKELGKPDAILMSTSLKSQSLGGGYKISMKGNEAVVFDEVLSKSYQFQILERDTKGITLVRNKGVGVEVITIDPQNGSFVLTDSGVQSRLWNRTNVWVGRCN